MSDTGTVDTTAGTGDKVQETPAPEVFDRDYVESIRKEAAKHRTEAKANADRLAELESKLSTFTEEAGTKEATANAVLEKANLESTRLKVALKHGISLDELELFLTGETEETLDKQAEALSKRSGNAVRPDPAQGRNNGTGPKSVKADFADFWDSLNN